MIQLQRPRPASPASALDLPLAVGKWLLFPAVLVVSFFLALPTLIFGLLLWLWSSLAFDKREFARGLTAVAAFGIIVYAIWVWLGDPLPWLWQNLTGDLAHHLWQPGWHVLFLLWAFNLWLAPACGVVLPRLSPLRRKQAAAPLKQPYQGEYELAEAASVSQALSQFERMTAAVPSAALAATRAAPSAAPVAVAASLARHEPLGLYMGGELDAFVLGGELCIAPEVFELHGMLVGEPRFGKTWTLIRLAAIAKRYGLRVVYLDMKDSRKTAALFLSAMSVMRARSVKLFPVENYDGWRGSPKALFNRLMEQIDPRTHPFYRGGVGSTLVSLAVNAPCGMPRNSYEFLERLDYDWLQATYATDAQATREIHAVVPHIAGLQLVFAGFFRGVAGALDGSWAFEDADACYLGIDSVAHKEEAALLGRYLIEDAADFATSRKPQAERVLLIIDEFGGLQSTNVTSLYEKIREAGLSVYAASQSYESLGPERDHVLAASSVKILHRAGNPRPILEYAGERERFTFSRVLGGSGDDEELFHPLANRVHEEGNQAHTIMRPQKELTVPVEDVQQLELGQIAYICGGKGGFAQVHPLAIPDRLVQTAASYIANAPAFSPLPPPVRIPPPPKQPKKKKIAASPGGTPAKKQQAQNAARPVQATPAPTQQQGGPGKRQPPQAVAAQQIPSPAAGSAGQAGANKPNADDDIIDFFA